MTEPVETNPTQPVDQLADQPMSYFEMGEMLYKEKKSDDDVDLVPIARNALLAAGCSEQSLTETFDANRFVKVSNDKVSVVQRTDLNKFFMLSLLVHPTASDTIPILAELLPNGPMETWVEHVEKVVAPFIAKNKLLED